MTKLLDDVIDRVRAWPEDRQDEAAQLLLDLEAQRTSRYRLTAEQVLEAALIKEYSVAIAEHKVPDGTEE